MVGRYRTWIVVVGLSYLLGIGFLGTHRASAQDKLPTGEEVFAKGVKSLGDPEKVKRIQSILLQQEVSTSENAKATVESLHCVDGRGHMNIESSGNVTIGKYDGTVFMSGPKGKEQIFKEGSQLLMARLELVPSIAQSYRLFFDKVTNVGKSDFEGVACYDIECERKDQANVNCYFSIESGLMIGYSLEFAEGLGTGPAFAQILYEDFQPIEDVLIPHKRTYQYPGSKQVIQVKSCKVNEPIDEKVFKP